MRVIVRVTSEMHHGRRFWLRPGQIIEVGGAESADVVFPRSGLMPNHFRLECDFRSCVLNALGGVTHCNDVPVEQVLLSTGDRIQAGQMQFVIETVGAKATPDSDGPKQTMPAGPQQSTHWMDDVRVPDAEDGLWHIVRATEKATLLMGNPSGERDPFAYHRSKIASGDPWNAMRVFRLMPAATAQQQTAQQQTACVRIFVARHLAEESRQRLSVSLQQIDAPLNELPSDREIGLVGWITPHDDDVISTVLGLAAQGRGTVLERPHPEWMLRSADPTDLTRSLVDCSDSFLDNLVNGFDLVWADCQKPPQFLVLVNSDRLAELNAA